jgi:hypothetical protein
MSKRMSRKELQSRLDIANRTVSLQMAMIDDLEKGWDAFDDKLLRVKASAFDMLVARV